MGSPGTMNLFVKGLPQLQFPIGFVILCLSVSCVRVGTVSNFAHHCSLRQGSHKVGK